MPRKYYSVPVEMESLPKWLNTGKARKVANDVGETERLNKRGREKQTRRNMKESERVRRYEESMMKKEKMVKQDKRRSEITNRGTSESGDYGCKTKRNAKSESHGKQERWHFGDGFRKKLEIVKRGKVDEAEKKSKKKSDDGFNGGKFEHFRNAVKTGVGRGSKKVRTREWVEIMQKEKNSTERCLIGRSWAWYSVSDWATETTEEVSVKDQADDHESSESGKSDSNAYADIPASWPICRLCIEDTMYCPIRKPLTAHEASDVVPVTGSADPEDAGHAVNPHTEMTRSKVCTRKSFRSRVASVFRYVSRREWRKTVL